MRAWCLAALAAATMTGGSVTNAAQPDAAGSALQAKAETCLRIHAEDAARYSASLKDAVDFLTEDVCASDVKHFVRYQHSVATLATWDKSFLEAVIDDGGGPNSQAVKSQMAKTRAAMAKVTIDPTTGDLASPPGENLSFLASFAFGGPGETPPELRVVAAEAVLVAKRAPPR